MQSVSDFQILIKSCSIQSRNDPSPTEVVHETKFSLQNKHQISTHELVQIPPKLLPKLLFSIFMIPHKYNWYLNLDFDIEILCGTQVMQFY